ncbi:S4 domain-containing protein [Rhodoplanes sp. TEM]|uniref:S4 domain-containing protein n=1 Tax=Rhodoplanes tepidamans TaxID=200616 RepID=A0ABT5J4L2_RHOTP|nr:MULTISPECIES: S4 domain-containing protein [Rhodoplanes]MDC7784577.1 S4 domain-containing protein [Rhodoplanes tepidamans]MDC7984484.1 S4 domain-containing protein [Rhodoplanes sp. TEM]MDQ0355805.1 ribosome-associated heat shock protein Hsp15 [Rhodoplanes tepidamans]
MVDGTRQRIDKWLWHARVVRTRSAAAALAAAGRVRVNGARIDAASRPVKVGDVVTVALDSRVRVLTVTGFAERRGSATDAQVLFRDETPAEPDESSPPAASRDRGAGRPTKRDRRTLDRLRGEEE